MTLRERVLWFSVGYLLCSLAGASMNLPGSPYVTFWLPSGFAVAILLLNESRDWRWLVLAMVPANLAFNLWQGTPFAFSLLFSLVNAFEVLLGAWLMRRFVAPWPTLTTLGEFIGLLGLAAVLSPMLGALIGAGALSIFGRSTSFVSSWLRWWTSEAMAIVLITPFILTWFSRPSPRDPPLLGTGRRRLEALALVLVLVSLTTFVLTGGRGVMSPTKGPLWLPLLWAGLRFGPRGATAANLMMALPMAFFTTLFASGLTPAEAATGSYVSIMQIALVAGSMAALLPAVVLRSYDHMIRDLHDSEERFRNLTAAAFEGVIITDQGRVVDMNDQGLAMFGCERSDIIGHDVSEFVGPENRAAVAQAMRADLDGRYEHPLVRKDGRVFDAETQGKMLRIGNRTLRMTAIRDVTERKRAALNIQRLNRVYSVLSEINQAIVREQDAHAMLAAACRIAVEKGRFLMAWAGMMDKSGERFQLVAHAGAGPDTLEVVNDLVSETNEDGRCAVTLEALRSGQHGICNDIAKDPRMVRWREAALHRNYRAMTSLPLKSGDRVIGTFNLYAAEVYLFDAEEMRLLDELAADISFAIEVYSREAQRRRAEQARTLAEQALLALNARYARHEAALTTLARSYVTLPDNLPAVIKEITELVARTLEVERVSIWRYEHGNTALTCTELFESTAGRHSSGMTLYAHDHPAYFLALAQSDIIAAGDALGDQRTQESGDDYLRPLGITSLLGTPVRSKGKMAGIVCCEHVGPMREWMPDEQTFAVAVASLVSALLAQVERHQLEAQLRQAQKMEAIGQLAGGVAHDFNNVLAVIQMQAGLLQDEPGVPPIVAESAREIEKATERAANLTRQLLLFSRRETLQPKDLDLNEVVSHITSMLQRIVGEDIRLQLRLAPEPLWIHADAGMMDQILMNLAVNSRDAMPKGGHLIIETAGVICESVPSTASSLTRPGPFVCLTVTDTGSGIAPEVLPRIFEPFFTTKDVGKGTGLGLATVFGVVEQHHGWIDAESELARGSTFQVYLPRLLESSQSRTVSALQDASVRGGTETILLVEDDDALRSVVCNALTRLGYSVIEAPTAVRALDIWREHRDDISVMLTDIVMPDGMNGKELAQTLRQESPALKVIYSSGYSTEIATDAFPLEEGVNFLAKPFPVQKLAQMVRDCLDRV
ncbi:MAG: MASE1 domain-containing protein [Vicinamibacterales bacterium]